MIELHIIVKSVFFFAEYFMCGRSFQCHLNLPHSLWSNL